ncbi:MAG: hypothetical protein RLZZ362_1371 [Actinomycetota bacterium]|jgi:uncharacterized protein (TIGR03086 family)
MNDGLLPLVIRAVDEAEPLVASVAPPDRRPTPCPDLDVESLVAHLIGGLAGFADVAQGRPLAFGADPDLTARGAGPAFRSEADRMIEGFSAPGMVDRTFTMPWGPTTGTQLLGFELIEVVVHGWDIARSLDVPPPFDDDVVAAALEGARAWVDDSVRTPQLFGPEVAVADDAPVFDRLVGFLGRDPANRPPVTRGARA